MVVVVVAVVWAADVPSVVSSLRCVPFTGVMSWIAVVVVVHAAVAVTDIVSGRLVVVVVDLRFFFFPLRLGGRRLHAWAFDLLKLI